MPTWLARFAAIIAVCALPACQRKPMSPPASVTSVVAPAPPPPRASAPAAPADEDGLLGVVIAPETTDVGSQLEGRLKEIFVRAGDHVEKDAVLATLDTRAAKQELAMARAQLATAKSERRRAQLDLTQARERVSRRESIVELPSGPVSTVSAEELSAARYQQKLSAVRLSAARANVAEKAARLEQLRALVTEGAVRAPFSGTVAGRYADRGSLIPKGAPIVRLIESGELKVRFALPEERANSIAVADRLRIATGGIELGGTVEKVAPEIDAASRMVYAEAAIEASPQERERLRSGQIARVFLARAASALR